ncbi:MaoC/PaaZ C-terminal domain-containing protein [Microbulbifer sp. SAOS-129_SWC]|uniref:MaoC/PaaZ C-terminal domain-containing protein n=1 Tax=Microbulbifer sp. SAOS-129_SWC TaxID=3145235 RepID=UPI003217FE20
MAKTLQLESMPSRPRLYLRALCARKSGKLPLTPGGQADDRAGEPAPERDQAATGELARVSLQRVRPDPAALKAYREVGGFAASGSLPATYPFVLAMPLQMELLVSDAFPFQVLGLVHVRNVITQYRPVAEDSALDLECRLCGPRPAARGLEFDLHTQVSAGGDLLWECTSTLLRRERRGTGRVARGARKVLPNLSAATVQRWDIPANIGRRYAAVSGDRNPIHLSRWSARLFGFPRAIAHGMWTKAHCLAALEPQLPTGPFRIDVAFKLPILLPASAQLHYCSADGAIDFAVKDGSGKKPHLQGRIESL